MEHLNYCRQILKQKPHPAGAAAPAFEKLWDDILLLCKRATKFILPAEGKLMSHDIDLRGLDDDMDLHIPYTLTALEFPTPEYGVGEGYMLPKHVVFAAEADEVITILTAAYAVPPNAADGIWIPKNRFTVSKTFARIDGKPHFDVRIDDKLFGHQDTMPPEAVTLIGFLNALSCSNVTIEKSEPKKAGKKIKADLPFDTYHILTLKQSKTVSDGKGGGTHRSPREHLRRGHIRRLKDKKVWVNSAIICAGSTFGKVDKDYRLD